MSSLTPTARVILGMLKLGIRTGYEIKKAIDTSTRFFWGASFGQIYPELHRLREEGLVDARDEPRGRVKRTEYTLTTKGEQALREWLTSVDGAIFELRDEGLLRLFFGDILTREEVLANLRARRDFFDWVLAHFRELEVAARTGFADESQLHPLLALRYGIGLIEWSRDWYAETERRLAAGEPLVEIDHDQAAGGEVGLRPAG
jgi:PadR family transcriptional regulator, regulatory protein AphA